MITETKFGSSSNNKIENVFLPDSRAAAIKSDCTRLSVTLTFLAKNGMLTIATAIKAFINPGPKTATIASASKIYGNAINTSIERIRSVSAFPPYKPARIPITEPMLAAINAATSPTKMLRRVPQSNLDKISLPRWSAPKM